MNLSPLQKARYEYSPKLPGMLRNGIAEIAVKEGEKTTSAADQVKKVSYSFSGGISDYLLDINRDRTLLHPRNR